MSQSPVEQVVRYGAVGLCVVAADFLVYLALLAALPGAYVAANAGGKAGGAALGFFLHKRVTFAWDQRDGTARQMLSYISLFIANLALSSMLLSVLISGLHVDQIVSKLIVEVVVIGVSFTVSRTVVYRRA